MLVAFSFQAKPGKEREFEEMMNRPESGRYFAKALGATRNILFLKGGRMIRVLEFPEGATPPPFGELAERDPNVLAFLRKLAPILQDGFDVEKPGSLEEFNRLNTYPLAYDVKV